MNITQVATATDSDPQLAERAWDILTPVGEPPLRTFQQKLLLEFAADELADRIAINAATLLQGEFEALQYDARKDDIPHPQAVLRNGPSNSVIVELDAPRDIVRIGFGFNSLSMPVARVGLHRLDGDQLTEKPTVEVLLGSITSITATENIFSGVVASASRASTAGGNVGQTAGQIGELARHSAGGFVSLANFTDARFAIVLRNAADPAETIPLTFTQIRNVIVRSHPAAPRFGLPDPRQPEKALFFWPTPDEVDQVAGSDKIDVQAGDKFAVGLQRFLDEAALTYAERVTVPLTVESDAPCRLNITSFNVGYQFSIESFADKSMEKQVLRFPGQQAVVRELEMSLPADAQVTESTIKTVGSFRADRSVSSGEIDPLSSSLPSNQGIYLTVGRPITQQFMPAGAVSASGVALCVAALTQDLQITLELQGDSDSLPSGRVLAQGTVSLTAAGRPTWLTVAFAEQVVVSGEPHWLVLRATSGSGMWVADHADTDSHRLLREVEHGTWTEATSLAGLQARQVLLSRGASLTDKAPFSLASAGTAVPPLPKSTNDDPDTRYFDLVTCLNDQLSQPANGQSTFNFRLIATSAIAGTLTVYRPHIKYDRLT